VEKLVGVYKERPNFADPEAQEEAQQRLKQVKLSHGVWLSLRETSPASIACMSKNSLAFIEAVQ